MEWRLLDEARSDGKSANWLVCRELAKFGAWGRTISNLIHSSTGREMLISLAANAPSHEASEVDQGQRFERRGIGIGYRSGEEYNAID